MGAAEYTTIATGTTVAAAFNDAVEQAGWEDGYEYSGTISMKASYGYVFEGEAPGTIDIRNFQRLAEDVAEWQTAGEWFSTKNVDGEWKTTRHTNDPRKHAGVTGRFLTDRMVARMTDKWAAATAFQLKGKRLAEYKARNNVPRGHKVFVFTGLASE